MIWDRQEIFTDIQFNFNINWLDKVKRKVLKGLVNVFDFQQVIEGPSRITASSQTLTDLVFTNRPDRIKKSYWTV